MPTQPLPDTVDIDNLSESNYTLVPYALKFTDGPQELPVASIVANKSSNEITSYILSVDGEWSKLNTIEVRDDSDIFSYTNDENIYQSLIGVSGPSWNEFKSLKGELNEFVQINPTISSPFIKISENVPSTGETFCNCELSERYSDTYLETDNFKANLTVCTSCGGVKEISIILENKSIILNKSTSLNLQNVVNKIEPTKIINTKEDDLYLYHTNTHKNPLLVGIGILSWWNSQKQIDSDIHQYIPSNNNQVLLIKNDEIIGTFSWNYLLQSLPTIQYITLFKQDELSRDGLNKLITAWKKNKQIENIFIGNPNSITFDLSDVLTPVSYTSGSIQFEEELN